MVIDCVLLEGYCVNLVLDTGFLSGPEVPDFLQKEWYSLDVFYFSSFFLLRSVYFIRTHKYYQRNQNPDVFFITLPFRLPPLLDSSMLGPHRNLFRWNEFQLPRSSGLVPVIFYFLKFLLKGVRHIPKRAQIKSSKNYHRAHLSPSRKRTISEPLKLPLVSCLSHYSHSPPHG